MKINFIHPDLGIGGAERLIVDAAVALTKKKHRVNVYTGYHNRNHCFEETKDGTFYVKVLGSFIPRSLFGYGHAFFAYIKMIWIAFYLCFFHHRKADLIICDQVSAPILVFKWFSSAKVIFYCHYPDKLLTGRKSLVKKVYRYFFDWLEELSTGKADLVFVNSHFTESKVYEAFPSLRDREFQVLYPSMNTEKFIRNEKKSRSIEPKHENDPKRIFLSINRYERKKNLNLAIEAFAQLRSKVTAESFYNCSLVMAGGYDKRVKENVEHLEELEKLTKKLNLVDKVKFFRSISDEHKVMLLQGASCVLYTPSHEHFGIVPLEAMFANNPVIAVNNGGPCETVEHKVTGFLCDADKNSFSDAMFRCLDSQLIKEMGNAGHERVLNQFSFESFTEQLNNFVVSLVPTRAQQRAERRRQ